MLTSSSLASSLVEAALSDAENPASAVTALMTAAATILQQSFGPVVAAELMFAVVVEARMAAVGCGITAEPVRH